MKTKLPNLLLFILLTGVFFSSCKNDTISENIPSILSFSATPENLEYGGKITISAQVKDNAVALNSARFIFSINDKIIKRDTVLLSKQSENISKEEQINLFRNAPDNAKLKITLELVNSEGGILSSSIENITLTRPVYETLYIKMDDDQVLELTRRITEPNIYECAWTTSNDIKVKILSNLTTPEDGIVLGNIGGSLDVGNASKVEFFEYSDPLTLPSKITFNIATFDLLFEGTSINDGNMYIGMAKMSAETNLPDSIYHGLIVMAGTGHFTKNGLVNFRGFPENVVIENILNPDFFEMRDGKYYFTQETGDYSIRYDTSIGFIFVYNTVLTYPTGIYMAGWGFGPPVAPYSTARSDYQFEDVTLAPGVFYYLPKVGTDTYQATVFLKVDATDFMGFNFYYQKGWGNPGYGPGGINEVTGSQLASSNLSSMPLIKGAVWRSGVVGAPFTNGVYTLNVNFTTRQLKATLVQAVE